MPYRNPLIQSLLNHACEAAIMGLTLGYTAVMTFFSDSDWDKITGPHGGMFLLATACAVLWRNKISSDKKRTEELSAQDTKEDKRRAQEEKNKENRHLESINTQIKYSESIKALAVESMKVNMKVEHALVTFTEQLKSCPYLEK